MSAETIYALSSGQGVAGVGVIRLSGSGVRDVLLRFCGRVPEPRRVLLCELKHPIDSSFLDQALVLYFKGPNSFTGEDVAEFHVHGGRAVIEGVLCALGALHLRAWQRRASFHGAGLKMASLICWKWKGWLI